MSDDVAGRLAEALRESTHFAGFADRIARYLLPVVDDLIERAADPVLLLHAAAPHDPRAGDPAFCTEDGKPWPCPTWQAATAALRGGDGR